MTKLIKLIFGDVRNVVSVIVALAGAYAVSLWQPEWAGWVLAMIVLGAALWQAA